MVTETEKRRFEELVSSFLSDKIHPEYGIGTYKEKSLHFLLKRFFEPDCDFHEVFFKGFVADIKNESGIIEIQTANMYSMKKKLSTFLKEEKVRIIVPIDARRHLVWLDPETGEIKRNARSTAGQNPYKLGAELMGISEFLENENLTITVVTIETDDYRVLNGWGVNRKKRAEKLDRIPVKLIDITDLRFPHDYSRFIPDGLSEPFEREDYARRTRLRSRALWGAMKLLENSGIIKRVESDGRAYKYIVTKK